MKTMPCILAGLLLLLTITGCKDKTKGAGHTFVPDVLVNTPLVEDVSYTYEYPGYLQAEQTVNLVARVSGFLEKISFVPGQVVKEGQNLFTIEPKPYIDALNSAKANVKSIEAQLNYAQSSYEKMKEAVKNKAVSEIDYLQAQSTYFSTLADLENAKAQLNTAKLNLDYCYIKAPFAGRISRNLIDPMNFVGNPQQPTTLSTLYKDARMFIYFNMAYSEYQNIPTPNLTPQGKTTGSAITIQDGSNAKLTWPGKLDYSSPNIDLNTGSVSIQAFAENPNHELLSGMYVKVIVPYKEKKDALVIPESSIGTNQAGRFIYVVNDDNTVEYRQVVVGVLKNSMREIVSGIAKGERYVVEALISVRPGMKVTPVTAEEEAKKAEKSKSQM